MAFNMPHTYTITSFFLLKIKKKRKNGIIRLHYDKNADQEFLFACAESTFQLRIAKAQKGNNYWYYGLIWENDCQGIVSWLFKTTL